MYYDGGGVHQQSMKSKAKPSHIVSLKSRDLFFALLGTHIKLLNYFKIVEILERTELNTLN